MAKHIRITLTDDLDGTTAVESVQFALDGRAYEIDLNEENAAKLRDSLKPYIDAGRKVGTTRKTTASRTAGDYDAKAVRAWAEANGVPVPRRGRIPHAVLDQYRTAGF